MKIEDIKFTIIMAAYNAEKYISQAIDSVLCQTYNNWELLIVDDGSVDETSSIIDVYAAKDNRITCIHQKNSGTAAAARNTALEIATGNYCQMLDSDDLISKDMLADYARILRSNELDMIVPILECFMPNGDILYKKEPPQNDYKCILNGEEAFRLSLDWYIHGCSLVKMNLIKEIRYDYQLINGDEFTTRKLFFNSKRIGFSKEKYFYRYNVLSTTKTSSNEVRMYECLLTDLKIYTYAVDNFVSDTTSIKCLEKVLVSLVQNELNYQRNKNNYSAEDKKKIDNILLFVYQNTPKDIRITKSKYSIIFKLSFGSYPLFVLIVKLIALIKKK